MHRFEMIGFDADDTLWHNEKHYRESQARFSDLLGHYGTQESILAALHRTEAQNLEIYGYGMKGFALSMIETAVQVSNGRVSGPEVMKIIAIARDLIHAPLQLLEHAETIIPLLAKTFRLMLVTKGDLRDQETKVARSGLGKYFSQVEILSDKGQENYRALLARHGIAAERFLMVGNSLRSDIWPVLALGASAVYVPHHFMWAHEAAEEPPSTHAGYHRIGHLGELPNLLVSLESRADSRAK